jgi:CRP-like cAMP-binding protein
MYTNLINHIRKYVNLDEQEVAILCKFIKPVQLKRKEFLTNEGQVCRAIYFVEKGCLRMYFVDGKSVERITQFALDSWWMSDYISFMNNVPSEYFIQAIEKSEVLMIDRDVFDELLKVLPQLERYFRLVMQKAVGAAQLRIKYMFEMTKEEFYNHFIGSFPEFAQRVPQYMIASYLGLTPEYVSELRKKSTTPVLKPA